MDFKRTSEDSWSCSDDRYGIRLERDPWIRPEGSNPPVYVVYIGKYGPFSQSPLATLTAFGAAVDYIKQDAALPVFNEAGDCRWCGLSQLDLASAPRWWFGCNLCETEMERTADNQDEIERSIAQHEQEFEPLHD